MREISCDIITAEIKRLCIEANYQLGDDIKSRITAGIADESDASAANILNILKQNYEISSRNVFPLCQDTGMSIVFAKIGQDVHFTGGSFTEAVNAGVQQAYEEAYLRKSVVADPLRRTNTKNNLPAIIYTDIVDGNKVKLSVMAKGFGAENQSKQKMFTPTSTAEDIINFVADGVIASGGKACAPCVIGVGIGGSFDFSAVLSKQALLRPITEPNPDPFYADMEAEILRRINDSGVGPQGLGGKTTCLGVNILTYPTHIAGLPVAYNYCCHASRHKSVVL